MHAPSPATVGAVAGFMATAGWWIIRAGVAAVMPTPTGHDARAWVRNHPRRHHHVAR